ncbi:hypothetical protein MMC07_000374, partial [Pseudocyphellaria aurata]|nr:hypothetical protein [Pseudocyphellaria aurata]
MTLIFRKQLRQGLAFMQQTSRTVQDALQNEVSQLQLATVQDSCLSSRQQMALARTIAVVLMRMNKHTLSLLPPAARERARQAVMQSKLSGSNWRYARTRNDMHAILLQPNAPFPEGPLSKYLTADESYDHDETAELDGTYWRASVSAARARQSKRKAGEHDSSAGSDIRTVRICKCVK